MLTRMELFNPLTAAPELPLSDFMIPNEDPVQIRNIDGLGPVTAEITSAPFATGRGDLFQGSSTSKRNIVLTLGLHPNWEDQTISSLRQLLYGYLLPEQWVNMRFFSDELPPVMITGIVESFEPNIFSQDPEIQVSIVCPKPDFIEVDAIIIDGTVDDGTTEVVINYTGTVLAGFEFRVLTDEALPEYVGDFSIINQKISGNQIFNALGVTVNTDQYFMLNTVRGARRIQNVLLVDGQTINILAKMDLTSVWPELSPGENVISVTATESGQKWVLGYFNRYGGL